MAKSLIISKVFGIQVQTFCEQVRLALQLPEPRDITELLEESMRIQEDMEHYIREVEDADDSFPNITGVYSWKE